MARNSGRAADALYIAWRLQTADVDSAVQTQKRLAKGEAHSLYFLRSWVIVDGKVEALLAPDAPLEQIAEHLWDLPTEPTASRWVEGQRACAEMARKIETTPVALGLTHRPEEWPYSSAARE